MQHVDSSFSEDEYSMSLDPWGYESNTSDRIRRDWFTTFSATFPKLRTLDIGAGTGFLTGSIETAQYVGLDISVTSTEYLNSLFLKRGKSTTHKAVCGSILDDWASELGKFDFIVATGVFYRHYLGGNLRRLEQRIAELSTRDTYLLTVHIAEWPRLIPARGFIEIDRWVYPYREFNHELLLQKRIS